jgi:hypothetical protein
MVSFSSRLASQSRICSPAALLKANAAILFRELRSNANFVCLNTILSSSPSMQREIVSAAMLSTVSGAEYRLVAAPSNDRPAQRSSPR